MPIKWNIAVLMFMFLATMLFAIMEKGAAPAAYAGTEGTYVLDALSQLDIVTFLNPVNYFLAFMDMGPLAVLADIILFDYAMFEEGSWQWIKYFFWCISFGWLISLVIALGRGVGSSA